MKFLDNKDLGILIFRIGIGIAFILHGYPKLIGGEEIWTKVGSAISYIGIDFYPAFWGLMAALAEVIGGIFLVTGIFFKPAIASLIFTMVVATVMKVSKGLEFKEYAHSFELGIVLLAFLFIGAGRYRFQLSFKK